MKSFLPPEIKCAAIISPAGLPAEDELTNGIAFLQDCGIEVKVMPHAFGSEKEHPAYLAATDDERANDFMQAYCDEDVDIIFASRGGYGCGRILDLIDWNLLKTKRSKYVAGYSDLTSLFFAMTAENCGTPIASVMTAKLSNCTERELTGIFKACTGTKRSFALDVIKSGHAKGTLLAGNLTVAASCAGTKYMPDVKGKILLLEDVGENIYRIDRLFNQLKLNGILERCAGIVTGYFTGCSNNEIKTLLTDYSCYVNGPVLANYAYGHEMPFDAISYKETALIEDNLLIIS